MPRGGNSWRLRGLFGDFELRIGPPETAQDTDGSSRELRRLLWLLAGGDASAQRVLLDVRARLGGFASAPREGLAGDLLWAARAGVLTVQALERRVVAVPLDGGDEAPLGPDSTNDAEPTTWFAIQVLDEAGKGLDGIAVAFSAGSGAPRTVTTNGAGIARLEDSTASSASATVKDVPALRKTLEERWKKLREGEPPSGDGVTVVPIADAMPPVALDPKKQATLVVVPASARIRLVGMHFDTAKSFLLPTGVPGVRQVVEVVQRYENAKVLVVGHTDTEGPEDYNSTLSLERADSIAAYLQNEVDDWTAWYDASRPAEKRWGAREDQYMLSELSDADGKLYDGKPNGIADKRYKQAVARYRKLKSLGDGGADAAMRKALVGDYMAFEGTTLPDSADPVTHGCGEFFPEVATGDGVADEENRRVEVFVFDGVIRPEPPAKLSKKGSKEYPEWKKYVVETIDFEEAVQVAIRAEDGVEDGPAAVPVDGKVKLKAIPTRGKGTYAWSTSSTKITLTDADKQVVTVVGGDDPSDAPRAEVIELQYTPEGRNPIHATHAIGVARVTFAAEPTHPWGYDTYEQMKSLDVDLNDIDIQPGPEHDFVSIKKGEVGKVQIVLEGVEPDDVFLASSDDGVCKSQVDHPKSATGDVIEVKGGNRTKAEAELRAHLHDKKGAVLGVLGVVVLTEITYKAELFRVKDSTSASTALALTFESKDLVAGMNEYYKQGVAKWDFIGGAAETDAPYDVIVNGKLDMEPGTTSDEQKKIIAKCPSTRSRVVYVHDLRWCYFLAKDAKSGDTKITLKNYGAGYLGYLGKKDRPIEDAAGNADTVHVDSVNTSTGVVTLSSPLTSDWNVKDKAAVIFGLGGLSGDPLWVKDVGPLPTVINYVSHELGHQLAELADIGPHDNLMHGGSDTGDKLRHRPLPKYYEPKKNEEQWKKMKGR